MMLTDWRSLLRQNTQSAGHAAYMFQSSVLLHAPAYWYVSLTHCIYTHSSDNNITAKLILAS